MVRVMGRLEAFFCRGYARSGEIIGMDAFKLELRNQHIIHSRDHFQ